MTKPNEMVRLEGIAAACVAVILVAGIVLRGAAVFLTWNWFVASVLKIPEIDFGEGVGFTIFLSAFFPNVPRPGSVYQKGSVGQILREDLRRSITGPLLVTIFAAFWHGVMVMMTLR
jgi:hypothetical protein